MLMRGEMGEPQERSPANGDYSDVFRKRKSESDFLWQLHLLLPLPITPLTISLDSTPPLPGGHSSSPSPTTPSAAGGEEGKPATPAWFSLTELTSVPAACGELLEGLQLTSQHVSNGCLAALSRVADIVRIVLVVASSAVTRDAKNLMSQVLILSLSICDILKRATLIIFCWYVVDRAQRHKPSPSLEWGKSPHVPGHLGAGDSCVGHGLVVGEVVFGVALAPHHQHHVAVHLRAETAPVSTKPPLHRSTNTVGAVRPGVNEARVSNMKRTAVAKWLTCSPPTKANRVRSPAGSLPDFRMWESCRTMPLVNGLSQGFHVSPALSFRRCSILTTITLIGSQDLDVKSHPNLFTHSLIKHERARMPFDDTFKYRQETDHKRMRNELQQTLGAKGACSRSNTAYTRENAQFIEVCSHVFASVLSRVSLLLNQQISNIVAGVSLQESVGKSQSARISRQESVDKSQSAREHIKTSKGSSTGSQQVKSPIPPATSMVTVSADDYDETVNANDGMRDLRGIIESFSNKHGRFEAPRSKSQEFFKVRSIFKDPHCMSHIFLKTAKVDSRIRDVRFTVLSKRQSELMAPSQARPIKWVSGHV
ncbi:hypothetical protein PR048_001507 [Dryococelus australis]|uniref:Uncharacterized protein n=1 Tax=Dryococelus australis TaxID=614101 RepID=A0ABQ9IHH3_9NEOP|nr:hypothetical protein PR048_001507 [Dryococelus australis]